MITPGLSVIVPVYNTAEFLPRCIESVLKQTYTDFELLLVDDGSTDNSLAIIEDYARRDSRIRVLTHEHAGLSATRNYGMDEALGRWVCFIDSDDWVEPEYLADFFRQPFGPGNCLVSQGIAFDGEGGWRLFFDYPDRMIAREEFPSAVPLYELFHNGCTVSKLFSLDVIRERGLRFIPGLAMHEDHIFVLNYLRFTDSIVLSGSQYYHYMRYTHIQTLCDRTDYTASQRALTSALLVEQMNLCTERMAVTDPVYLKDAFYQYGLWQMLEALRTAKWKDYRTVLHYYVKVRPYLRKYYTEPARPYKRVARTLNSIPAPLLRVVYTVHRLITVVAVCIVSSAAAGGIG